MFLLKINDFLHICTASRLIPVSITLYVQPSKMNGSLFGVSDSPKFQEFYRKSLVTRKWKKVFFEFILDTTLYFTTLAKNFSIFFIFRILPVFSRNQVWNQSLIFQPSKINCSKIPAFSPLSMFFSEWIENVIH